MRVKLAKAFRVPGSPLRPAGAVIEVDDDLHALLVARGVVSRESDAEPVAERPVSPEPVEADDEADEAPGPEGKRPARSASTEKWREYAKSQGIDPKGLSKQEIIAAMA